MVLTPPTPLLDMHRPLRHIGPYGQPTDVSYTQAQINATYEQTTYATSYGEPPNGYSTWTAPPTSILSACPVHGTAAYDTTTATDITNQASYAV